MRKSIVGGATGVALVSGVSGTSDMSFVTDAATGWPTGGTDPYVVSVGRVQGNEEKILVQSRSGNNHTVATDGRGYDGTTAIAHQAGESVEHVLDADTVDEANAHVNDTTRDDHTQYLNTARHDVTSRHAFGAALGTPGTPAAVANAGSAGAGTVPARDDHVHALPSDIAGAGLSKTGTVLAVLVDDATIAIDTDTLEVKDGGIDADALADGAVTAPKLASGVAGAGLTKDADSLDVAVDDSTIEISSDALRVKDGGITSAKIATGGVAIADIAETAIQEQIAFSQLGTLAVGTGTVRWYPPYAITLLGVRAAVGVAPTGAAVNVDVNKDGTSIWPSTTKPSVAAAAFVGTERVPDTTGMLTTNYLTVDIDQVGSSVAGENLVVTVRYKKA